MNKNKLFQIIEIIQFFLMFQNKWHASNLKVNFMSLFTNTLLYSSLFCLIVEPKVKFEYNLFVN